MQEYKETEREPAAIVLRVGRIAGDAVVTSTMKGVSEVKQ